MPPSVPLCMTCSASLPLQKTNSNVIHTICCSRPICPSCISANPRLARYNPCLRCLAGVKAVNPRSSYSHVVGGSDGRVNLDGGVYDEDIFVVEDEQDSDPDTDESPEVELASQATLHPQHPILDEPNASEPSRSSCFLPPADKQAMPPTEEAESGPGVPNKYYIRPDDTLLGISLKLGIERRILCRLNNLSPSTLRTTPHLLHARPYLILPPSAPLLPALSSAEQALDEECRARFAVERAETRFQAMTKETDRDVAKAYVALAELPHTGDVKELERKEVESGLGVSQVRAPGEGSLEAQAMDQYYDDDDWETHERAEGRNVAIQTFPYLSVSSRPAAKVPLEEKSWWRWRR